MFVLLLTDQQQILNRHLPSEENEEGQNVCVAVVRKP